MNGVLLIDKPASWTSHDVVNRIRKIFQTRRVGHAGTLDPFATGLLVVGVNAGTKQLTALVGTTKTYLATARLGATSTTEDPEGTITERTGTKPPTRKELERAFDPFRGGYEQTAPIFSAKKINGKKLYELARQGKTAADITLPKKHVTITTLDIISYDWPVLVFAVDCSSGTYIRSLARDLGEQLGTGAYLTELRRTRVGAYTISDAIPLESLNTKTATLHL